MYETWCYTRFQFIVDVIGVIREELKKFDVDANDEDLYESVSHFLYMCSDKQSGRFLEKFSNDMKQKFIKFNK